MATYAIGDVQGCYRELCLLLEGMGFDPARDRLWFTGDLVNRGPESLAVLRFVHGLGAAAVTVLGNHDLHLLARAWTTRRKHHKGDTLDEVLGARDRDTLLEWLGHRPLLHRDAELGYTLIHAGLPPQWDIGKAGRCAGEVEAVLRGARRVEFLDHMYGNEPDRWSERLEGWGRLRFITNCLTRMRFCTADGRLDLSEKGPPGNQADSLRPWYELTTRRSRDTRIIFGHWATLSLAPVRTDRFNAYGLDTGCVWGGSLTAMRLEDRQYFSVKGALSRIS